MVSAWQSQAGFVAIVALVGVQRLWELRKSRVHELAILKAHGREHAPGQMAAMRALHGAWLIAMVVEVLGLHRPFHAAIALFALIVFAVGQALRIAAMRALGDRWTVKIMTLPGVPSVEQGIFRWLRHPNYLGVALEIFALPLVHDAWLTSVCFTLANAALLRARILAEEKALTLDRNYDALLVERPRFLPRLHG
jgi:methyltransferase